ncbi:MAG TPA: hypothetical protein VHG91_11840 [Longimicrobium sp.]|nr:hypothetical protein [Longimicrobium sp.]
MTTPRRKRLSRAARLRSAKRWIATYRGHDVVRGYRKWFGVSDVCAVLELRMLDVAIPGARLEQARQAEQSRASQRVRRLEKRARAAGPADSDDAFAFVAGYTEGGAAFGNSWEDMERMETGLEAGDDPFGGGVSVPCPAPRSGPDGVE